MNLYYKYAAFGTMGQSLDSNVKKAQQSYMSFAQPAIRVAHPVLLGHHWVCPVLVYNHLIWSSYQIRHQKTIADSQDCWEDYCCPAAQELYTSRVRKKVGNLPGPVTSSPLLFELLPSGQRYRALSTRTARCRTAFSPQAIFYLTIHNISGPYITSQNYYL